MRYEKGNLLDKKFKAIADNTRWEILLLLKEKPLTAGEIASHFTISFASISYHLQKLEESDLVTSKQFGMLMCGKVTNEIYQTATHYSETYKTIYVVSK